MNYSFGLLKPDCLKRGLTEEVLRIIETVGLKIVDRKEVRLKREEVDIIWSPCVGMWFYEEMVKFSLSGDSLVFLVEGEDSIKKLNDLVGHYDPIIAKEGTIRRRFGTSPMENLIHSSGNKQTFNREANLFFSGSPYLQTNTKDNV
jgi:nucleoside-diphosphate kinase